MNRRLTIPFCRVELEPLNPVVTSFTHQGVFWLSDGTKLAAWCDGGITYRFYGSKLKKVSPEGRPLYDIAVAAEAPLVFSSPTGTIDAVDFDNPYCDYALNAVWKGIRNSAEEVQVLMAHDLVKFPDEFLQEIMKRVKFLRQLDP